MAMQVNEENVEKVPDLEIAQMAFLLSSQDCKNKDEIRSKLLSKIMENLMTFYYRDIGSFTGITIADEALHEMEKKNAEKLKDLDAIISDAEKNLGETEVRDAYYKKAEHLCRIGDRENALSALAKTFEKTIGIGKRIDLVFFRIRIGLFYGDHNLVSRNIAQARDLMEQGGDWDRKNRLKAYEGLYCLSIRDFKKAAELFLDAASTFTSYELMSYERLIFYTVVSCMLALERNDLKEKVIRCSEIQEQFFAQNDLKTFLTSLYDCNYSDFFNSLSNYVIPQFKVDRYLAPHFNFYAKAIRTKAYKQLLSSYSSLTLSYMAESFGVDVQFMDNELYHLIATGELPCKIDSVRGVVEMSQRDTKSQKHQEFLKHCDILLNRIQKLSHVIEYSN